MLFLKRKGWNSENVSFALFTSTELYNPSGLIEKTLPSPKKSLSLYSSATPAKNLLLWYTPEMLGVISYLFDKDTLTKVFTVLELISTESTRILPSCMIGSFVKFLSLSVILLLS